MAETIISELAKENNSSYITNVITDGHFKKKLTEHMSLKWAVEDMNSVFLNATNAVLKFISPHSNEEKMSKLLCLGKVQSGKTAFFISAMALAFDNGYDIAYVIGGTKNNLLSQNRDRILEEFSNNDAILIMDINNADARAVRQTIANGCKVILMVLKQKSNRSTTNLANLEKLTSNLADIPSLIVDDEGDEYSPGGKNPMTVSGAILHCVNNIKRGTYLSVTATPQSNLLLSTTLKNLSPDDCVLVEPGRGYTGANVFHDSLDNILVRAVGDTGEFDEGIPASFSEALRFYILGCGVRALRGDNDMHSMLIHPSQKTAVQNDVFLKVKNELDLIKATLCDHSILGHEELVDDFRTTYLDMQANARYYMPDFADLLVQIEKNLNRTIVYQINTREGSGIQTDPGMDKFYRYKIYVGGNMLERGITLKNLSVTYIYRTAKTNPVDNALQRARWFGYKEAYLDLCRVYMTNDMKEYFVDINQHENFLWETIRRFLQTGLPLQAMERIFVLSNDSLILTRRSVSQTVKMGTLAQGYSYSKSIDYGNNDYHCNYELIENYLQAIDEKPKFYQYGKHLEHQHKYYEGLSFKSFFQSVIQKYLFPLDSSVNRFAFQSILDSIEVGDIEDSFTLIKMRDGENQFRSTIAGGIAIKELTESYQVSNGYVGDKAVLSDKLNVQIHYVYTNKDNPLDIIPFLTINCPYSKKTTTYVTGEFKYGI